MGHSHLPLRSIKALEFLTKSRDMLKFNKNYPQFSVNVEILKEGELYRLHLVRLIKEKGEVAPLQAELGRLVVPVENELGEFFESEEYHNLEEECLGRLTLRSTRNEAPLRY